MTTAAEPFASARRAVAYLAELCFVATAFFLTDLLAPLPFSHAKWPAWMALVWLAAVACLVPLELSLRDLHRRRTGAALRRWPLGRPDVATVRLALSPGALGAAARAARLPGTLVVVYVYLVLGVGIGVLVARLVAHA